MQINENDLPEVLVALGANLPSKVGLPSTALKFALANIRLEIGRVMSVSRFFKTPCFPRGLGPDYVNAVASFTFGGKPNDLLQILHQIEAKFGRKRKNRWGGRVLDLDLLAFGNQISPTFDEYLKWQNMPKPEQIKKVPSKLILPHPRIQDRGFVLKPLMDIAQDWRHPVCGLTVSQMYANLSIDERAGILLAFEN